MTIGIEVPIFLRYPGGKRRLLPYLAQYIPARTEIRGCYVEPFVGGGSVFFSVQPLRAILADINDELIHLYRAIRSDPQAVWDSFRSMPGGKRAYNRIRRLKHNHLDPVTRAARLLYLNRTCFKGMWRQNGKGEFNIGYGGQSRRWVIAAEDLLTVSKLLRGVTLKCGDFEDVIDRCGPGDFVFADPPYRPGHRELSNQHYVGQEFTFDDQRRLASALARAEERGAIWTMTNSNHRNVVGLYGDYHIIVLPRGTGSGSGVLTQESGEAIICSGRR